MQTLFDSLIILICWYRLECKLVWLVLSTGGMKTNPTFTTIIEILQHTMAKCV